jgi:hypothetical protein
MEFYHKEITDRFPGGLAYLIVKVLHARYRPQNAITTYEFSKALWTIKDGTKEFPDVLFARIAYLKSYILRTDLR